MEQIQITQQIKNALLIGVVCVVYLFPVLLFAQEVEKESTKHSQKIGLNSYEYHKDRKNSRTALNRKIFQGNPSNKNTQFIPVQPTDKKITRDFVLYNYAHVADDIINGKGMYLETLFYLLGVKVEEKSAFLYEMRKMLLDYERIPDFSNNIAVYGNRE